LSWSHRIKFPEKDFKRIKIFLEREKDEKPQACRSIFAKVLQKPAKIALSVPFLSFYYTPKFAL